MKIAVCEDSAADMEAFKKAIAEADSQLQLHIEIDPYSGGEELIDAIEKGETYPLVFLDIYMHALDGVQTARKIRSFLPDVQLAFLTSSKDFMLDAFDLNALYYLLKPVSAADVKTCLERFCERSKLPLRELILKSASKEYRFPLLHIQKIISHNKGIDVYQQNMPPVHIPMSFAMAEEQLDPALFLKLSRGYIVHMAYIRYIDRSACRLKDDTEILLSRGDKEMIRKKYNDYLFQK